MRAPGPWANPSLGSLLETLIPVPVLAAAVVGILVARTTTGLELRPQAQRGALVLSSGLWLAPSVGLYLFSVVTSVNLLWPTYTRSSVVGAALLLGGALTAIASARARRVALLVVVTIGLLAWGVPWHSTQDWRGAAAEVNALVDESSTPVLMHAAFIEAAHVEFFDEPEYRSLLLAQLSRYPVEGSVLPLPYNLTERSERYLEERIVPRLSEANRFVLVTLTEVAPLAEWFEARFEPLGFGSRQVGEHGSVLVTVFDRREPA